MRRFAISDIHGCALTFEALLDRIALSTQDELNLLGDYIDRGPDSKGVLDAILRLQREGYAVHCLRGNHEDMLLEELALVDMTRAKDETLASFGCDISQGIPQLYRDMLHGFHDCIEVDGYILVHGGLNFKIPDPFSDKKSMYWIRWWYSDINREWLGDRIVVHGHSPYHRAAIIRSLKYLAHLPAIGIDNGCVFEGLGLRSLCAFDLTNRELFFQDRVDTIVT